MLEKAVTVTASVPDENGKMVAGTVLTLQPGAEIKYGKAATKP